MMKWKDINREHVIKAIQKYDEEGIESYSRTLFLYITIRNIQPNIYVLWL